MVTWQEELRAQLDRVPGAAERLLKAIDEGRVNPTNFGYETECGTIGCAYGHIYGDSQAAVRAASRVAGAIGTTFCETPLQQALYAMHPMGEPGDLTPLRGEIVAWLAEHGTHPEVTVRAEEAVVR
jgi:hypothetical protein